MRYILYDLKTGDVFSELIGWNKSQASLLEKSEWTQRVYEYSGMQLNKKDLPQYKNWEDRSLYVLPVGCIELETLT